MWYGGHVGGHYKEFYFSKICMKVEFSSQRREMLSFLIINMAAVTSREAGNALLHGNPFTLEITLTVTSDKR